jgi:hypothetical protein
MQMTLPPALDPMRIEQRLASSCLTPIASGTLDQRLKMYFYAQSVRKLSRFVSPS